MTWKQSDIEIKNHSQLSQNVLLQSLWHITKGNDTYTLDMFDTDNMSATPAFFRPISHWRNWMANISEVEYKKLDAQIHLIIQEMNDRYNKGW